MNSHQPCLHPPSPSAPLPPPLLCQVTFHRYCWSRQASPPQPMSVLLSCLVEGYSRERSCRCRVLLLLLLSLFSAPCRRCCQFEAAIYPPAANEVVSSEGFSWVTGSREARPVPLLLSIGNQPQLCHSSLSPFSFWCSVAATVS
uniref:Uncharacterized protein n=1 Tax=Lactuca sativa TaxID=4236 RepID=A0A9R1XBM7_LACSA|nr:hypothetical protein LSAT_V11C500230820 [Lactuca sativa]